MFICNDTFGYCIPHMEMQNDHNDKPTHVWILSKYNIKRMRRISFDALKYQKPLDDNMHVNTIEWESWCVRDIYRMTKRKD